jgi:arylsulfatase A-like enzyme
MPTLCALAKYDEKRKLNWDGKDIWAALTNKTELAERDLYWAGPSFRSSALRRGDWKLIVKNTRTKPIRQLFNLAADPNEALDLAPKMPLKVKELSERLDAIASNDRDAEVPAGTP